MSALTSLASAVLILLFCIALAAEVYSRTDKWRDTDPSLRFGLSGLIALGALGTLCLFVGLFSINAIVYVLGALVLVRVLIFRSESIGLRQFKLLMDSWRNRGPRGIEWAYLSAIKLCELIVLIGVLAPPDTLEWDSLAYHLAAPKIWMTEGHISYISYIHQSNFPGAFDYLYLLGLMFGAAGAKAFVYAAAKFGGFAIFGLARQLYGRQAAWWAVIAYATVPVVLWLSGTAYIDVPNGLCAGLGIAMAALYCRSYQKHHLWLSAIMLGLATGSKYTGLQTIAAVGFVLLIVGIRRHQAAGGFKAAVLVSVVALLIACPWYVKNVVNTGNPVYPFFSSKLGGKNWSPPQAEQYSREQASFGVGRDATGHLDITQIGHAILGLAYQPGRYINPLQGSGGGMPLGAVGVTVLCSMLAWSFSGRSRVFELTCLSAIGISLLMWFLLSQQSRYIVTLTVPLAVMFGGAVVTLRIGQWLTIIAAAQAAGTVAIQWTLRTSSQIPVVVGAMSPEEFQRRGIAFYDAAKFINQAVPKTGRVALYDEVFGDLLDVPYYWANPGHSNEIPYAQMHSGADFVSGMQALGFTHVYINLAPSVKDPQLAQAWLGAMGMMGTPEPFSPDVIQKFGLNGFEQPFVPLIADAVSHGQMTVVQPFRTGILFKLGQ